MTEELKNILLQKQEEAPGNAILVLRETADFPPSFFAGLAQVQSVYSNENLSFWVAPVSGKLKKKYSGFADLNHTPTLQEAIDMVMMEKLERDLLAPDEGEKL